MKKIVFVDIPMKEMNAEHDGQCYAGTGNAGCAYSEKVIFPINAVLAEKLTQQEVAKRFFDRDKTDASRTMRNFLEKLKRREEAVDSLKT